MLRRLKNYNDIVFIIFLIFLLGGATWLFSHNVEQKVTLLQNEIQKINKQHLFFTKQNNDLTNEHNAIVNNINHYLQLEVNISENKTEELKKTLSENAKSTELLAILPPSEIANIQQKENIKKINEDITSFKQKSAFVWLSLTKLTNEEFNNNDFVIGNIKDNSLKNDLANNLATLLKKEKPIFTSIAHLNGDIGKFSLSTENLTQFLPLYQLEQEKNKSAITSVINSLSKELYLIQTVSVVGLVCLILLLFFVIFRKKKKKQSNIVKVSPIEKTVVSHTLEQPVINVTQNNIYNLINDMNSSLSKHINLHFDSEYLDSLSVDTKDNITLMIEQFIKFSLLYSFSMREFGDIIVSLREEEQHKKLIFKDNGKGLLLSDIKDKIKQQFGVNDNVFAGKSEQQILSLIFKPNFNFITNQKDYNVDLSVITQLTKKMNAQLSIKNHEPNGIEFVIIFPYES